MRFTNVRLCRGQFQADIVIFVIVTSTYVYIVLICNAWISDTRVGFTREWSLKKVGGEWGGLCVMFFVCRLCLLE